ncbi:helix-turn-helix domain-containing protein [Rarobacter incanus]|uniref:helix-turn-helix domain-containing protein n=1 Tax=Rarobacter incanus TaxID=153494 RepID=UPI0011501A21
MSNLTRASVEELRGRATISIEEAGRMLGVSRPTAYVCADKGEIPTIRLGRQRRVPVPALLRLLGVQDG